jgi:nitrate reductase delta subunit
VSPQECSLTLQAAGLLLGYPDEDLQADLLLVAESLARTPCAAQHLGRLTRHLAETPLPMLQQDYVDTFDLRRRCCLYLTYFSYGDTRKRGMALLRFSSAYRTSGADFVADELPDHLAVVCEFAATCDLATGLRLLGENRAGLELLRAALADAGSPYLDAVEAIRAVLPEPGRQVMERAHELALTGPPEEEVGLEPFGPPETMGERR